MRVIPIGMERAGPADLLGCDEPSGIVKKVHLPLVRREFLKGTGLLLGTLASGSMLAALAPSTAWALELKTLSTEDGKVLMAMGRTLYPHKKLPDAVYALLVKDLDAAASADAATAKLIKDGIAALNQAAGGGFLKVPSDQHLAILHPMENTPFFGKVRGQCVTSLYNNDMAFAVFGYPGSAWEKGGYITRGFQDLKWLPNPPQDASPPPYLG